MKLRITPEGAIRGLWDDGIDWTGIGRVSVHRASHVEFCPRRQQWYVQSGRPRSWLRRVLQRVLHRPCGEILYTAATRGDALCWESRYYGPSGPGWRAQRGQRRASRSANGLTAKRVWIHASVWKTRDT